MFVENNKDVFADLDNSFLYIWLNRLLVVEFAQKFLSAYMKEIANQSLLVFNLFFVFLSVFIKKI